MNSKALIEIRAITSQFFQKGNITQEQGRQILQIEKLATDLLLSLPVEGTEPSRCFQQGRDGKGIPLQVLTLADLIEDNTNPMNDIPLSWKGHTYTISCRPHPGLGETNELYPLKTAYCHEARSTCGYFAFSAATPVGLAFLIEGYTYKM